MIKKLLIALLCMQLLLAGCASKNPQDDPKDQPPEPTVEEEAPAQEEKEGKTPAEAAPTQQEKTPPDISSQQEKIPPDITSQQEKTPPDITSQQEKTPPDISSKQEKTPPDISSQQEKTPPDISSQQETATEDPWLEIQDNYYNTQLAQDSMAEIEQSSVLRGSHIIPGTMTKQYSSENLNSKSSIAHFTQQVREHGLMQALRDDGFYFATVEGPADPIPGTAVILNNKAIEVFEGDQGASYRFQPSDTDKQAIDAALDLEKTTARYIILDGFMDGILFDDGTNQIIKPFGFYRDIIDANTVFTVDELLEALEEHIDVLTYFEDLNKNLDPEKPNPALG